MSAYNYNVPDFDFSAGENDQITNNIEAFLDTNSEADVFATPRSIINETDFNDQDFFSSPTLSTVSSGVAECYENPIRKSLSVGNLDHNDLMLRNAMNGLSIVDSSNNTKSSHQNGDVKLRLRSRSIAKSEHDEGSRSKSSHGVVGNKKFVSMAEAIKQFQQRTPQRFHSKSKLNNDFVLGGRCGPIYPTIPQSPALQTKRRTRPVSVISQVEKEMKDFEEAQKHKIKAQPLNARILNTPPAISKSKKPSTIPEPFNLTEVAKKRSSSSSSLFSPSFEFHAKPVPKFVREPAQPLIKSSLITIAKTSTFLKRPIPKVCIKEKEPVKPEYKGCPTKPIPFSFDDKIGESKKKKEKLINEVLEKEKKAREFHAQPIPKVILNRNQGSNLSLNRLQDSDRTMMRNNCDDTTSFKARPATVLLNPPFIPKKSEKPLTEIVSFPSNFENRAAEREQFYQRRRERDEMLEFARQEMEAEKLRVESEEVARIRKQAEYQAQPIRHYKQIKSITPKKITDPVSPKFSYIKNKENISR